MSAVALSGNDTVNLNNRVFADLADGDCAVLTFPNDIATVKTGKDGNAIFGLNQTGQQAELVLRVVRGSADDKFLNQVLANQRANFSGFALMIGQFIKKIGDGAGNVASDTYITSGGVVGKNVEGKMNVEGEAEQSVAVWHIKFAKAVRVIT